MHAPEAPNFVRIVRATPLREEDTLMHSFLVSGMRIVTLLLLISPALLAHAPPASSPSGSPDRAVKALRGAGFFEQDFLKASNAGIEDNFGVSVAINETGTLMVVGARYEDSDGTSPGDDSIPDAGAADVFERTSTGWVFCSTKMTTSTARATAANSLASFMVSSGVVIRGP